VGYLLCWHENELLENSYKDTMYQKLNRSERKGTKVKKDKKAGVRGAQRAQKQKIQKVYALFWSAANPTSHQSIKKWRQSANQELFKNSYK